MKLTFRGKGVTKLIDGSVEVVMEMEVEEFEMTLGKELTGQVIEITRLPDNEKGEEDDN